MALLAPLGLDGVLVHLLVGVAFGWVLESSGFGDARRLAAQFYFTEVRVLQVMFTAIVTAMLLLLGASALGVLDLEKIAVPATYLASGVLGGVLLGIGFIVGGYCPGTSIVSAGTGKIDGAAFLLGVGAGVFAFGETADGFRVFLDTAGAMGVVTLPGWLGLPAGVVGLLVLLMALGMFFAAEALERTFGRRIHERRGEAVPPASSPPRVGRLAVRGGGVAVAVALAVAVVLAVVPQPTVEDRVARLAAEHDAVLASRAVHLDPLEVLGLMQNQVQGKPGRVRLVLLDLRSEADYNLFHLVDARRTTLDRLRGAEGKALAGPEGEGAFLVLLSNDEAAAEQGWRVLRAQGATSAYVLAGGTNLWLDLFREGRLDARPAAPPAADDRRRHPFERALGERYPYARPDPGVLEDLVAGKARTFEYKAKPLVRSPTASGGCG